ncbi:MAG: MBL fold metallo-hydrolase [bacterium]
MKICILASGSKGNCIYVEDEEYKVLIDIGISFKQLRIKLNQINVDVNDINAVFITHEHTDHVMGLRTFSNNMNCDFYLTKGTLENLKSNIHETMSKKLFHIIKAFDEIKLNNMNIIVIPTHHDAKEPVGFRINHFDKSLIYITDTGYYDITRYDLIRNATMYIFESNYDPTILYESKRMLRLKKRVAGDLGHMSNEDSAINLSNVMGESTKLVVHAHISLECNTEEMIVETFRRILFERNVNIENIRFICAKQYEISEVFEL